jgi:colicin import membrane protein
MVFVFSNTFFAQTATEKKAKAKTEKAAKEAKEKAPKIKKDGTPDKRFKDADKDGPKLKKDGTVDKRYKDAKDNNASVTGQKKSAAGKAGAAANKAEAKAKKEVKERVSNERAPKTPDKVTGTYKGKKVFTGPRGGRYYINSNGNKTYISDDK